MAGPLTSPTAAGGASAWRPRFKGWGRWRRVFWGLVITSFVLGIRWLARQGREERPERALGILRERYARGEINKEEFEARRRDLDGGGA